MEVYNSKLEEKYTRLSNALLRVKILNMVGSLVILGMLIACYLLKQMIVSNDKVTSKNFLGIDALELLIVLYITMIFFVS